MNIIAVVTGATRNLGLALVQGLAERLEAGDVVYLTGRDPARVSDAVAAVTAARAEVRGAVVDASDADAVAGFRRIAWPPAWRHRHRVLQSLLPGPAR